MWALAPHALAEKCAHRSLSALRLTLVEVDQVGGFLDVPAQTAMGLRHDRRQQIAEQRGGPVAVGLGQRRALDRIAAQRGQRRRVALQFRHNRPKALRPRQLTVQQGHKLAFAVQTARAAIRVITLDQLREAGESTRNRGAAQAAAASGVRLDIVGGHGRIPGGEQVVQRAVEGAGSGLQEPVGPFLRPLHLLLLGEAPADDEVDGGFGEGGRDDLAMVPALRVVRDRGGIVLDVGGQPGRRLDQPRQAGIAAGQGGDILGQLTGAAQGLVGVAVPQPPLDPLQPVLQGSRFNGIVVRQALGVLTKPGQPHGNVSGKEIALLRPPPLRTVRASCPAHGSSLRGGGRDPRPHGAPDPGFA